MSSYESDMLLGEVLDALDDSGSAANTYVMMVSDHGENCVEHRQLGKNNMYDSASRVACILAGPGIKAGQSLPTLASLNDVFPTVLGTVPPHPSFPVPTNMSYAARAWNSRAGQVQPA